MAISKTLIYITVPRATHLSGRKDSSKVWGLSWFVDKFAGEVEPTDTEQNRKNLLKILKDIHEKNITDTSKRIFAESKLTPPYNFDMLNMSKCATDKDEDSVYSVSGIGDAQPLIDWLKVNKFEIDVRTLKI